MTKIKLAIQISRQTLVGPDEPPYPIERGNCFSVQTLDGKFYMIVNFVVENLKEIVKRDVPWPICIRELSEGVAVVEDERIPKEWYRKSWCKF